MAENLHNTPATREQHELYQNDPEHPRSKPYSTKQMEANEQHRRTTLYHATLGAKTFHNSELVDGIPEGWFDAPVKAVSKAIAEEEPTPSAEIDVLRAECDKAGIKYDKRWGIENLRKALLKT